MPADDISGFSELIGLEFADVSEGYSRGTLTVSDRLTNPYDVLHGAAAYAMADSGMGGRAPVRAGSRRALCHDREQDQLPRAGNRGDTDL